MKEIIEAFEYAKRRNALLNDVGQGRMAISGISSTKIEIEMILDDVGNMITAYPIMR